MLDDVPHKGEGNAACCALLEHWKAEVEKGEIDCCAIILTNTPTGYTMGQAGVIGYEFAIMAGLEDMKDKIKKSIKNRTPKPADPNAPADRVMYNLVRMSCSFDFLAWICNAEMTRIREGAPAPLKIGFWHGHETTLEESMGTGARLQNFENIMRPLIAMFGAIEDPESADLGRPLDTLSMVPTVDAFNAGESLPKLTINDESRAEIRKHLMDACGGKLPVTITLREASHFPNRNSDVEQWIKFARWLQERGEKVLFIRDTEKAGEQLEDFNCMPPASMNLFVRTAVYQVAKANLFVSNGPAMLAVLFSKQPWLFFNQLKVDNKYIPGTPDGWKHFTGIASGEQWPWARSCQRVIYGPDTFENIKDAWLKHVEPRIESQNALVGDEGIDFEEDAA